MFRSRDVGRVLDDGLRRRWKWPRQNSGRRGQVSDGEIKPPIIGQDRVSRRPLTCHAASGFQ
jgi:hypothetical protein